MSNRSPDFSEHPDFSEQVPAADEAFSYEMDEGESVTGAVLTAVAAVTGDAPVPRPGDGADSPALPPLYTVVDSDALDSLFDPRRGGGHAGGFVQFPYANCIVTVESDGRVLVQRETE